MLDFKLDLDYNPDTIVTKHKTEDPVAEEMALVAMEMQPIEKHKFDKGELRTKTLCMSRSNSRGKYEVEITIDKISTKGFDVKEVKRMFVDNIMESDILPVVKILHTAFSKMGAEVVGVCGCRDNEGFVILTRKGTTIFIFSVEYKSLPSPTTMILRNLVTSETQTARFLKP